MQPSPELRVAAVQCPILWNEPESNLRYIEEQLHGQGTADLLVFPETILTGFSATAADYADREGRQLEELSRLARHYGKALAGSLLTTLEGQLYNAFFLIDEEGQVQLQPKRHLFAPGGERGYVQPATERRILSYRGWRILPLVCYDLRFPVWCRNVDKEYDLILVVANWPKPRRAVWQTLLRARAMENLCYVVGVNRVGSDPQGLIYTGDSALITPRGEVVAEAAAGTEGVVCGILSYEPLSELRRKFPVWADADRFILQL